MMPIKILLIDDHSVMRMGLAALLGTQKDLQIVGDAGDGETGVRKALKLVPNSAAVSESDTADMIENEKRTAGFLMEGGMPVGVFELDFSDAVPEIASVGIRPDLHGNGYGKAALTLLENDLIKRGYRTVKLLVAGTNLSALALYRTGGYRLESIHSRWYETELPK